MTESCHGCFSLDRVVFPRSVGGYYSVTETMKSIPWSAGRGCCVIDPHKGRPCSEAQDPERKKDELDHDCSVARVHSCGQTHDESILSDASYKRAPSLARRDDPSSVS